MNRIVDIPKVGKVGFPDHMSDQEVQHASAKLHNQANPVMAVVEAVIKDEGSKGYQKKAELAQILEANPALASLAAAGLTAGQPSASGSEPTDTGNTTEGQSQPRPEQSEPPSQEAT